MPDVPYHKDAGKEAFEIKVHGSTWIAALMLIVVHITGLWHNKKNHFANKTLIIQKLLQALYVFLKNYAELY